MLPGMFAGARAGHCRGMRYLVVVDHTVGTRPLTWTVVEHAREEGGIQVDVVVPADEDELVAAQQRLDAELAQLRAVNIAAAGQVIVADAFGAIQKAAEGRSYDGVIIATHASELSRWLHLDLAHRVERDMQVPVEWLDATTADEDEDVEVHVELPRAARQSMDDTNLS